MALVVHLTQHHVCFLMPQNMHTASLKFAFESRSQRGSMGKAVDTSRGTSPSSSTSGIGLVKRTAGAPLTDSARSAAVGGPANANAAHAHLV